MLQKAVTLLTDASLKRHDPELPLLAIILWTIEGILGVLWQTGPLMWIHQAHSDLHKITSKSDISFALGLKAHIAAHRIYSREPDKLTLPFPLKNSQSHWAGSLTFQEMITGFTGILDSYLPKNKLLSDTPNLPIAVSPCSASSSNPIALATLTFSDANKKRYGILIQRKGEENKSYVLHNPGSVQLKLLALYKILIECQNELVNVFSDSQYAL